MEKLIAKHPILYQGRMYEPGDALPAYDTRMVGAWLEAGTAAMVDPEATARKATAGGQEGHQNGANGQGGQEPGQGQNAAEGGGEAPQAPGQETGMVEGHLDPKQLESMTKAELEQLAGQLGVDLSNAKNNTERAAMIAAVTVQAPVDDENGSAQ